MRDRPEAIIVDFFAGSGTTLNAVNLLNAADGGQRRCILVTNNEVSAEEADVLTARGLEPGQPDWEALGICRSVTWPRTRYTVQGHRADSTPLPGDYLTGRTTERTRNRKFVHVGFANPFGLDLAGKKQLVGMIDGLPQNLVTTADCPFVVADDAKASVLFDPNAAEPWFEALEEQEQVTDLYIVAEKKRDFDAIKARVQDALGPYTVQEEEKRPLADGFAANVRYFKLDFLDPDAVEMGYSFDMLLPTLWLLAGAHGPVPTASGNEPWLVFGESRLAVLLQSDAFDPFLAALQQVPLPQKVFIITDSADEFYTLRTDVCAELPLPITAFVQLYRSYLDTFRINTADTQG